MQLARASVTGTYTKSSVVNFRKKYQIRFVYLSFMRRQLKRILREPIWILIYRISTKYEKCKYGTNRSLKHLSQSVSLTFCSIIEIQTVSPQGFIKSDLAQWDATSNTWYVNVSYTPVKKEPGPEVFCYTAFSSAG